MSHIQLCFRHWESLEVSNGVSFLRERPNDQILTMAVVYSVDSKNQSQPEIFSEISCIGKTRANYHENHLSDNLKQT